MGASKGQPHENGIPHFQTRLTGTETKNSCKAWRESRARPLSETRNPPACPPALEPLTVRSPLFSGLGKGCSGAGGTGAPREGCASLCTVVTAPYLGSP